MKAFSTQIPPSELLENVFHSFQESWMPGLEESFLRADKLSLSSELKRGVASRLTEISGQGGGAVLTFAFSLVRDAQRAGESVLWLSSRLKPFYPPDAESAGVDLKSLPVLFLSHPEEAYLAASQVLGSGAFALLVWDLVSWKKSRQKIALASLGRLNVMARHHRSAVLVLTDKRESESSLGCLVSLRLQVEPHEEKPELMEVRVVRDKRGRLQRGKKWSLLCELPDGLPSTSSVSSATIAPSKKRMAG